MEKKRSPFLWKRPTANDAIGRNGNGRGRVGLSQIRLTYYGNNVTDSHLLFGLDMWTQINLGILSRVQDKLMG